MVMVAVRVPSEGGHSAMGAFYSKLFGRKKTSSKSRSGSRDSEEGPSRPRLSQEPYASCYTIGSRQRRSQTPVVSVPRATRGGCSSYARKTTQMQVIEWFEVPRHLKEITHTPPTPFEESEAPTHVVLSGDYTQGVADSSVSAQVLSNDQTEAGEHSSAQEENNHTIGNAYELDSPDESMPMEFLMSDIPHMTRNPESSTRHALDDMRNLACQTLTYDCVSVMNNAVTPELSMRHFGIVLRNSKVDDI
ncbi:hypothetical protein E3N88_04948 [Mikania micrantha]|uniref:Uncharacterized protein n=1 Tax=Mikania micrantha TaxID=192012 RepID=A0A5N6PYL1_9ASTR|nr:hypothetical protein E3N88_04948 [Mikania micrantha]